MLHNIKFLCVAGLLVCAVSTSSAQNIQGTYFAKGNKNAKLVFQGDRFTFIDVGSMGDLAAPCCDTMAAGNFKVDGGDKFILLNTPSVLSNVFVSMHVEEQRKPGADSITFRLKSPGETAYRKYNAAGSLFEYTLAVEAKGAGPAVFKENNKPFKGTVVSYYNPGHDKLYSLMVSITPAHPAHVKKLEVMEVLTMEYKVKDPESNYFELTFPDLTEGFFTMKRLKDDYVKVVNNNTLIWDGVEYIKH